jgi:hypothetical protein
MSCLRYLTSYAIVALKLKPNLPPIEGRRLMLRCLNTFNPVFWCFSEADYDDLLQQIQVDMGKLYNSASESSANGQIEERMSALLEKNFATALHCLSCLNSKKPERQLAFLIAEILGAYGQICSRENCPSSRQILCASFNMHLYSLGITNEYFPITHFTSLSDLKKKCSTQNVIFSLEEFCKMGAEALISQAYSNTLALPYPDRRLLSLAKTIRWLENACHVERSAQEEADQRTLQHLLPFAEGLLQLVDNDESRTELALLRTAKQQDIY